MFDTKTLDRFWNKVRQTESCWIWTAGNRGKTGYGSFKIGKVVDAHRVSWMIHNGPIPKGLCVCHKCDNRVCVRPDHLFLGTKKDNHQDGVNKGRILPPIGGTRARKLTRDQILQIRNLYVSGVSDYRLSDLFQVHRKTIYEIVNVITYKDVM